MKLDAQTLNREPYGRITLMSKSSASHGKRGQKIEEQKARNYPSIFARELTYLCLPLHLAQFSTHRLTAGAFNSGVVFSFLARL